MIQKRLAIIGNGMASARLVDELHRRGGADRFEMVVFGEEPVPAYNRMQLSRVLAGEEDQAISFGSGHDSVVTRLATRIDRIDPAERRLTASDGTTFDYDLVVIATGSSAFVPPIVGARREDGSLLPGVHAYRTLADCHAIRSRARPGDNAVVLGGGLLGLEAAKILADRGLHVSVIHLASSLMETQLDATAGGFLQRAIERAGLHVRVGRTIKRIIGKDEVDSIELDDGTTLAADIVVLACGIRPRVDVAKASGIAVNRGIPVNDALATAVPGVYALGECAEHDGRIYGLVQPIFEQCDVLADVLCGTNPKRRYRGSKLYARLKVAGVDVASMGVLDPQLPDDEVLQIIEERIGAYRKLIVRDNKLIGAQFVVNDVGAAMAAQAFERGDPLPVNRLELLCAPAAGASENTQNVCLCNHVSKTTICEAIRAGCDSVEAVGEATRAGTGCGSCRSQIARLIVQARSSNGHVSRVNSSATALAGS